MTSLAIKQEPGCVLCSLHQGARSVCIPDRGSPNPLVYFVSEAPGKTEDDIGSSFIGKVGELFDGYMKRVGLEPSHCRWGNIVRCIPYDDNGNRLRAPNLHELDSCSKWLETAINQTQPIFIVPLGSSATSYFLGEGTKVGSVRGRRHLVQLPTVRYRYQRMLNWLALKGIDESKFLQVTENSRERMILKAIQNHGFKDVPTKTYTVFPMSNPAQVLYGNPEAAGDILQDLNTLVDTIQGKDRKGTYETLLSADHVCKVLDQLQDEYRKGLYKFCAFDFESNSLERMQPTTFITTLGFTPHAGKAWGIPWNHRESPLKGDRLTQAAIRTRLNQYFEEVPVAGSNFKYDYELGYMRGFNFPKIYDDTLEMGWTLTNDTDRHDLDYMTSKYTDFKSPKQDMREAQSMLPKDER